MRTVQTQRLLMAALQLLTGDRATGAALVKSTVPEGVEVPANCYAYPLPESETGLSDIEDQRIIRTAAPIVATPEGTQVSVTSLLGGEWYNSLRAGTQLYWTPPVFGLESHSRLVTDMIGGTNPPERDGELMPGFVRNIITFDELSAGRETTEALMQAAMRAAPAIVIAWKRTSSGVLRGQRSKYRPDVWFLHAISENRHSELIRRHQATHIMDRMEELLSDLGYVDGATFSAPPAVVEGRLPGLANTSIVSRVIQLATYRTVATIDRANPPPGMTAQPGPADWATTSYRLTTTDDPPKDVVRGVVDPMPQGSFSDEFSDEFD